MKSLYKAKRFLWLIALTLLVCSNCAAPPSENKPNKYDAGAQFDVGDAEKLLRNDYPTDDDTVDDIDYDAYIRMPQNDKGKSRNSHNYTMDDMGDLTYENFLKLRVGMSLSEIKTIFPKTEIVRRNVFSNEKMEITVLPDEDSKLKYAQLYDYYRLSADEADISMEKFLQLKIGMQLNDVEAVLGKQYYKTVTTFACIIFTWYSEEGEIEVVTDPSGAVLQAMQKGLQYAPIDDIDIKKGAAVVLTSQQLLENFNNANLGIDYGELEELTGQFIPLEKSKLAADYMGETYLKEKYYFNRVSNNNSKNRINLTFILTDGKLQSKHTERPPDEFLPETELPDAEKIVAGMNYDEVRAILGADGFNTYAKINKIWDGVKETFCWELTGNEPGGYLNIQFFNRVILNNSHIEIKYIE